MKYTFETKNESEARVLMKAHNYKRCLEDIVELFRKEDKYGDSESMPINEIREMIHNVINDHAVDLYD